VVERVAGGAGGPGAAGVGVERAGARSPELLAILDEHVDWLMRENPTQASTRGDFRFNDQLRDESPEAYERRRAEVRDRLARLEAIDTSAFTEEDRLDADLLAYELTLELEGARFHPEQMPVDALWGVQVSLPQLADSLVFPSERHYVDYAARLERVPRLIEQTMEQMRRGMAAGRMPPRAALRGVVEQALSLATEDVERHPQTSPFYKPFLGRPEGDPVAARARRAISEGIVPAFREFAAFVRDEYLPAARESIAASDAVDGVAWYNHRLRRYTTLPLTAGEIHEIGLREVARIRAEMMEAIARTDFPRKGELEGEELFRAFVEHLRTDPRFYYDSEAALLAGYREIAKRIDAELPGLFGTLPRNSYGVREMPLLAARTGPTAYYYPGSLRAGRAGYFVANTYRLDQRPKYEMIALTLHEAAPGHHLQISLAQELEGGAHEFRTLLGYSAFVEGWALYAERLGLEMGEGPRGMFEDPYDDFGRLTYEMWRACRLVVDTGMHAMGWSRERAIEYMLENSALTPLNIEREVDRYIAWPGQACAYKIGELKIRELRAMAERELGERFDVREFHDVVLGAGALPLPVLERRVQRWVQGAR